MNRLLRATILTSLLIVLPYVHCGGIIRGIAAFIPGTIGVAHAEEKKEPASITQFKVEPLYRAVRLTWKASIDDRAQVTFQIYRSMATPEAPYTLVTSIGMKPGMKKFKYIDKNLQVEENYFYKIVIPETKEAFGPLQVRPPFSLPTT
ncbi:MAG: hypothetical protein ABIG67_06625 [Pseudomonadota bacterium]